MLNWVVICAAALLAIGLIGFIVSLILLIVQAVRKKKLKRIVVSLIIFVVLIALGAFAALQSGIIAVHNDADMSGTASSGVKISSGKSLSFRTTDINGEPLDSSVFSQYKVTMINRWEPWCEPCKNEMPDFQALYEKYGDQGLNIIGVYSDENGLQEALDNTGVSYPIVLAADDLDFDTKAVPATIFVDSNGYLLDVPKSMRNPLAGSMKKYAIGGGYSYEQWEDLILGFLG